MSLTDSGSFKNTYAFLKKLENGDIYKDLDKWGREGANLLARATPLDTGKAASSWDYEIEYKGGDKVSIWWTNTDEEGGANVIILLQYGHGTGTGGYVRGRDFINPTMRAIFDRIAEDVWKRVTSA